LEFFGQNLTITARPYVLHTFFLEGGIGAYQKPENRPKSPPKPKNGKKSRSELKPKKNFKNNDQNHKFVIFNPSSLDTTAKY